MADLTATYRMKAGWLLLILLTGYGVLSLLVQSIGTYTDLPDKDPVTIHEARIAQLKEALPASGEVGYVTTVENEKIFAYEKAFQNVEYLAQYVLTQYTLAPLIVRNSPELPLVVGNFLESQSRPRQHSPAGRLSPHHGVPHRSAGKDRPGSDRFRPSLDDGYFFVYVLTPLDLNYHLMTSLNRIFLCSCGPASSLLFSLSPVLQPFCPMMGQKRSPHHRNRDTGREKDQNSAGKMNTEPVLSVVMPVYNERETVLAIIGKVLRLEIVRELVIVDDGSDDGTGELLRLMAFDGRVRTFFHDRNRGKGAALRTAFQQVTGAVVAIQDADLEYDPAEFNEMIRPIQDGVADVVFGSRPWRQAAAGLHVLASLGNGFLTFLTNLLYNTTLTDMETCYKMFRKRGDPADPYPFGRLFRGHAYTTIYPLTCWPVTTAWPATGLFL